MATVAGLTVLIVEDDEDAQGFLEYFLVRQGARVRLAATAAEARASVRDDPPDVIIADITLPDEDGLCFIRGLRADPFTQGIPAVAITGHTDAELRRQALDAGFQRLITKPLDVLALPAAIMSVVHPGNPGSLAPGVVKVAPV
jgi:DNA-binding response OmpR family regulator